MKILLIDLLYIGDLIFASPMIHALRDAYPQAEIDFIIDQRYREIYLHNPHLTRLIAVDRVGFRRHPLRNLRFIMQLRRQHYDLVINLHAYERATIFTAFSGAKIRCGFAKRGIYSLFFTKVITPDPKLYVVDDYLKILNIIGIPWRKEQTYTTELWLDPNIENESDRLWQQAGLNNNFKVIGINPGGSWSLKRWTTVGYAELIEQLEQKGFTPVFFGGTMDLPQVNEILSLAKKSHPIVFTGKINLLQLAALVRKCLVLVSGDTGPLHIAASQQVPIVALYGPTDPGRFLSVNSNHIIIKSKVPCLGCSSHKCKYKNHRCMEEISSQTVLQAVVDLVFKTKTESNINP